MHLNLSQLCDTSTCRWANLLGVCQVSLVAAVSATLVEDRWHGRSKMANAISSLFVFNQIQSPSVWSESDVSIALPTIGHFAIISICGTSNMRQASLRILLNVSISWNKVTPQQSGFPRPNIKTKAAIVASYCVIQILGKQSRSC